MANDRVEAVERALERLNCCSSERPALSLKQLAERSGFYKSTILRRRAAAWSPLCLRPDYPY
ncbi:MAG: hypothetical protein RQ754_06585 [Desulfuromonadales bacterium]|nr:hypothetical protein [Desulfuromonadales bacterium]